MPLCGVTGRFQVGRSPQKFFCIWLSGLGQLQSKIQVRFENIRLGRHRLAIRRDRVVQFAQSILHKAKIEPRLIVRRLPLQQLAERRFGSGIVSLFNRGFGLGKFLRLGILNLNLNVMNRPVCLAL